MSFWLLKTNPDSYSFEDLLRAGTEVWDGVRNNLALIHLRQMRKGDRVLVYHSGAEKAVVGDAKIVRSPYPDPALKDPKLVVVDIEAGRRFPSPVTLVQIKKLRKLKGLPLLRISRLSVMPVTKPEWDEIGRIATR